MNTQKNEEIKKTINNPMVEDMKPWQEDISKTISKTWQNKIAPDQISTGLDKRENKISHQRKPEK